MKPLTIVVDLDSIVINLLEPWLEAYNRRWNDKLTVADIKTYAIEDYVKPECGMKVFEVFHDQSFYRSLPPLTGAVNGVYQLQKAGHDVVICSASAGDTAGEKYVWCRKHMPFFDRKNIFVGARKELLCADIFIDDAPQNLEAYSKRWPTAKCITIAYPYNEHMASAVHLHARCHRDTAEAWKQIVKVVNELAEQ